MKAFAALSASGQARRLRRLALNALAEYDLPVRRVRLLTYHFNAIFRLDTAEGRTYVLRVNIPGIRSLGEIRSEALWLSALRRDTDLGVPKPVLNRRGGLVTTAEAGGVPEPRHCVVFEWLPGRDLKHAITPQNYRRLGELTARLHEHAESWSPPGPLELKTHDRIFLFDSPVRFWEMPEAAGLVPPGRAEIVQAAVERIQAMLDALYAAGGPPRILHADLHQGNLRLYRGEMCALDFDDCLLGHFVQDVGITFYYIQGHSEYDALTAAYRSGYESRRPWVEAEPGQIAGMMAARGLLLAQFLSTSDNPGYRELLPGFFDRMELRLRAYLR